MSNTRQVSSSTEAETLQRASIIRLHRSSNYDAINGLCPIEKVNLRVLRRPTTRCSRALRSCSGRTWRGSSKNSKHSRISGKQTRYAITRRPVFRARQSLFCPYCTLVLVYERSVKGSNCGPLESLAANVTKESGKVEQRETTQK